MNDELENLIPELAMVAATGSTNGIPRLGIAGAAVVVAIIEAGRAAPIDMVLHCLACGLQHIDAPEGGHPGGDWAQTPGKTWNNPPHRSHLCHGCGYIWRPADVPTNGVKAVNTKGKADSKIVKPGCLNCATAICDECGPGGSTR